MNKTKSFLSVEEEERIVACIREAEGKTSGEIRVHLAKKVKGTLWNAATRTFKKLGMIATKDHNGVLFYLALKERQFVVIGDSGIHARVPTGFWDQIRDAMQNDFKKGDFAKGLMQGIKTCGIELARYFPRQNDDRNELPDQISR